MPKEPSAKLCKAFENGLLKKYGMCIEQLETEKWFYAGGNKSQRHINYYKLVFPKKQKPIPVDHCVCGQLIQEQCYIARGNKTAILTIGNCCIKKFLGNKSGRTCEKCGDPHKNRKDNRCHTCRTLWHKCADCDKEIKDYARCFNCNKSHKKEKLNKEIERKRKEREAKDKEILVKKNDSEYLLEKQKIKDFEKSQIKYFEISGEKKDKNNIHDFFKKRRELQV